MHWGGKLIGYSLLLAAVTFALTTCKSGGTDPIVSQDSSTPGLPGSLDESFGIDGKVTTPGGRAFAVAIQSNGKIVVAGTSPSPTGATSDFALARYNTDGTLDSDFGTVGKVTTHISDGGRIGSGASGLAVAIQTDGKIVVVGQNSSGTNSDFALARYNIDGSLDTDFGIGGKVTTHFGDVLDFDFASAVAIQTDGKIVAAGVAASGATLVRYNIDGSLDVGFGIGGKVTDSFGTDARAVAIQSEGKVVTAGGRALVRYNIDGSLDTGFGTGGKVTAPIESNANAILIQPDGKIVTAGSDSHTFNAVNFTVVRYNIDGSLETGFGTGGVVTTPIGPDDGGAFAVALQSDGKIVAAGFSGNFSTGDLFALVRYNTDGSLDASFGTGGKVTTSIGLVQGDALARCVAIQPDGKIVAAGDSFIGNTASFTLVRYWP